LSVDVLKLQRGTAVRTPAFRSSSLPVLVLAAFVIQPSAGHSQESRSRRSQRVKELEEIAVASPDGQVTFKLLSNAERLSYAVTMGETAVVEPSPLQFSVDGFDLTSGVVFSGIERAAINETYPWHGGKATAVNRCRVATVSFTHDLSMTRFSLEIRAFDDGAAYRFIVPGEESASRVPDERSAFVIPAGSQVWYHGMDGHYEAAYRTRDISEVPAGDWAGVPLTFKLPGDSGFGTITEANLVNYSGMALEADGRRGWVVGLGHRQPLNYPFELRYGRDEGKRLGRAASITGTITTPWRVVLAGRDLNTLVNSDIVHNLCPPADARYWPSGVTSTAARPPTRD
jgi:alpha-glucosidase